MDFLKLISRTLSVVDRSLRKDFPDDYDKRCMYAAFGISTLLQDAGVTANIVGGDFLAMVVSTSGERVALQGFGYGADQPSHYWVEAENTIVDVGPHYLPRGARFAAAAIPLVAWAPAKVLPTFLRYRPHINFDYRAQLQSTPEIVQRMETFIGHCRMRFAAQTGQPKLSTWLLADMKSLEAAAQNGNVWARNAIRFTDGMEAAKLPF